MICCFENVVKHEENVTSPIVNRIVKKIHKSHSASGISDIAHNKNTITLHSLYFLSQERQPVGLPPHLIVLTLVAVEARRRAMPSRAASHFYNCKSYTLRYGGRRLGFTSRCEPLSKLVTTACSMHNTYQLRRTSLL